MAVPLVKPVDNPKRRSYVKDPDVCRTCRYGQNGFPCRNQLGKGKVVACIGYVPAMERV